MANERRVINKPKDKPIDVEVSTENITIKVPTAEERITAIETYLTSADPYIRSTEQIDEIKKQIVLLNEEITRIAGVQARANNYLDNKLSQIDETLSAIVTIVKKHDDDYKELMTDIDDPLDELTEDAKPKE